MAEGVALETGLLVEAGQESLRGGSGSGPGGLPPALALELRELCFFFFLVQLAWTLVLAVSTAFLSCEPSLS